MKVKRNTLLLAGLLFGRNFGKAALDNVSVPNKTEYEGE